jgi:multicomponent Na+:H+ antiporter subunit D
MMSSQLPALQIILPLLMAPIALMVRNPRIVWLLSLIVTWMTFVISIFLLMQVLDSGTITYRIGGWAAPLGH